MGSQEPGPGWRVNERPTTAHYAGPARLGGSILGVLGVGARPGTGVTPTTPVHNKQSPYEQRSRAMHCLHILPCTIAISASRPHHSAYNGTTREHTSPLVSRPSRSCTRATHYTPASSPLEIPIRHNISPHHPPRARRPRHARRRRAAPPPRLATRQIEAIHI